MAQHTDSNSMRTMFRPFSGVVWWYRCVPIVSIVPSIQWNKRAALSGLLILKRGTDDDRPSGCVVERIVAHGVKMKPPDQETFYYAAHHHHHHHLFQLFTLSYTVL